MNIIPNKSEHIASIVSSYSNPLLLKIILRLNEHFYGYCRSYQEGVSFQELLQSTGVEQDELEKALNELEKWDCISREGERVKNTEGVYWYAQQNISDIEFFGWTKLNKKELTDILEATQPEIYYTSKKIIHISGGMEARLLASAQKRIDNVWGKIEKEVRLAFGVEKSIRLPISYALDIQNPLTIRKDYPSLREAVEDGAELEGKFRLCPSFSSKGRSYRTLPFGMRVYTENREDGDYQIQNEIEWIDFQKLSIAVQEYSLEKITAFSQRMKQVHPEKIFPETAVPV